jgi:hypothetical protein
MDHSEEYKGHSIYVSTRPLGRGYVWIILIDGSIYREQVRERPQPEEMALREGIWEAKFVVDQMTAK